MLESSRRPLREAEKRLLRAKLRARDEQSRRATSSVVLVGAAVFTVLWATTLAVTTAPFAVVSGFWLIVGGGITTWVQLQIRRDSLALAKTTSALASALRRNEAEVWDIQATGFAEFEESEDEGACYAFQLQGGGLLFLVGQEFYPAARFPSLDFSLVYPLEEEGTPADMWIEKRGPRARPSRTLSSSDRERLDISESLEQRPGSIDQL